MADLVEAPALDSEWHYPAWTNGRWSGPWRVVRVGEPSPESECIGTVVALERIDGPPEDWASGPNEVELSRWPAGWEPWAPEIPDFPPSPDVAA